MIRDETLAQWKEWASRDDAFNHFVPSDIRELIWEVERLQTPRNENLCACLRGLMDVATTAGTVVEPRLWIRCMQALSGTKHEFG